VTFARYDRIPIMGLLNISCSLAIDASERQPISVRGECSKKFVQQGRSRFDARSVLPVREHGKRARTPLADFFNIPIMRSELAATRECCGAQCRYLYFDTLMLQNLID